MEKGSSAGRQVNKTHCIRGISLTRTGQGQYEVYICTILYQASYVNDIPAVPGTPNPQMRPRIMSIASRSCPPGARGPVGAEAKLIAQSLVTRYPQLLRLSRPSFRSYLALPSTALSPRVPGRTRGGNYTIVGVDCIHFHSPVVSSMEELTTGLGTEGREMG